MNQIINSIQKAASVPNDTMKKTSETQKNEDENDVFRDIISLLQMLGGINPEGAAEFKIRHDFKSAISFLSTMVRQIVKQWNRLNTNNSVRLARSRILTKCFETLAEIMNANIQYFDSVDSVHSCLLPTIDIENGIIGNKLSSDLQQVYDFMVIDTYKSKLMPSLLGLALKASKRLNIDIKDTLPYLPNHPRKYAILSQYTKIDEDFIPYAVKCATESNDVDTIVHCLMTFPDSKNTELKSHYFNVLAEVLSTWLNEFLLAHSPGGQIMTNEQNLAKAYQNFQKCIKPFSNENDRKKLFSIVGGTDVGQALFSLVKRGTIDLNRDEPMMNDLREILSHFY
ncbi:hypothetical protein GPJ56_002283 [Histomonas meleagridis]|uniref:uncharacterized protein n=1 Tax=Histomonas meleagridis TaxID=135588 RepID=UPI00355AB005|nr:hypothetical protein GPJ56_002283 [Histomonas meleagridis]KAH0804545.1 hypothetical protein GO595_003375 [Histomonas meleagridis]